MKGVMKVSHPRGYRDLEIRVEDLGGGFSAALLTTRVEKEWAERLVGGITLVGYRRVWFLLKDGRPARHQNSSAEFETKLDALKRKVDRWHEYEELIVAQRAARHKAQADHDLELQRQLDLNERLSRHPNMRNALALLQDVTEEEAGCLVLQSAIRKLLGLNLRRDDE